MLAQFRCTTIYEIISIIKNTVLYSIVFSFLSFHVPWMSWKNIGQEHSLKYLLLFFTEERKSYNGMRVSKCQRIVIFLENVRYIEQEMQFWFTESCAGVPLPSTCLCEYECACVNEMRIYEQTDKSLHFKVLPQQIPNPWPSPSSSSAFHSDGCGFSGF